MNIHLNLFAIQFWSIFRIREGNFSEGIFMIQFRPVSSQNHSKRTYFNHSSQVPATNIKFGASMQSSRLQNKVRVDIFDGMVILGGARTPFVKSDTTRLGKPAKTPGLFRNVSVLDLAKTAIGRALNNTKVEPSAVDELHAGSVYSETEADPYRPKQIAASLGIPQEALAFETRRVCGTGFETVRNAAGNLSNGSDGIAVACGVDSMTRAPYMLRLGPEGSWPEASLKPGADAWLLGLIDRKTVMYQTANRLAAQYGITLDESNVLANRSHNLASTAQQAGRFSKEIAPVNAADLTDSKLPEGVLVVDQDNGIRHDSTLESISKLSPIPDKLNANPVVTAANASSVVDGAAAVVVSTQEIADKRGLKPLVNLKAYAASGVDPQIMGIGPAPAILAILEKTGLTLDSIDILEINEAFAPQVLAVVKEITTKTGYDATKLEGKLNPDGGAIAIGHPLAASGSRIILHTALKMVDENKRYAIVSACIGGGQGVAMLLENPHYKAS